MRIPMQHDHFGYRFLQRVSSTKLHPGWDLNFGNTPNADLGLPVYPMTDGEVVYAEATGNAWGNLMVVYHPNTKNWTRYGHLQKMNYKLGDKVQITDILATCGKSGTSSAHLHWDLIIKKLSNWQKYTTNMSKEQVLEYYADGIEYVNNYKPPHDRDPLLEVCEKYNSNTWGFVEELGEKMIITPEQKTEAQNYLHLANEVLRR